jgi:subtilisin family serine protease
MSGTSMACPHVCGLLACLVQKHSANKPTAANIRKILKKCGHVIDIAAEGIDTATGVGFLTYLDEKSFDKLLPRKESALKKKKLFKARVT